MLSPMSESRENPPQERASNAFMTTRWSLVIAAGGEESGLSRRALEALCRAYWYPLYAFARREGRGREDAEDLVQGFFVRCIEKDYLAAADGGKGRFRSFLLIAFKRYMAKEHGRARATKRGGGRTPLALDALTAEHRYALEPAETWSADRLYERRWALTLLERVLGRVEDEQTEAGKSTHFEALREFLVAGGRGTPYAELAAGLGMTEGAVKVAVHRLRARYREILNEEIADTVATPDEIEDERRHLLRIVSG
jgi:RNA polymerase sigma factor (sigma-70 family)